MSVVEPATLEPTPQAAPASPPLPAPPPRRRWSTLEVWTLGVFSLLGLAGFVATFVLLIMRSPHAEAPAALRVYGERIPGPPGERGPAGPPGPPGPQGAAGENAFRIVRTDCSAAANCTAECHDDEILLGAYCSPGRIPVGFTTERTVLCRVVGRAKVEVIATCLRAKQ